MEINKKPSYQVDKGGRSVFYMGHDKPYLTSRHLLQICWIGTLSSLEGTFRKQLDLLHQFPRRQYQMPKRSKSA